MAKYRANTRPLNQPGVVENHWGVPFKVMSKGDDTWLECSLGDEEAELMIQCNRVTKEKRNYQKRVVVNETGAKTESIDPE